MTVIWTLNSRAASIRTPAKRTPPNSWKQPLGCFQKQGVLFVGVLVTRAPLFEVYIGAPDFPKLPYLYLHLHIKPTLDINPFKTAKIPIDIYIPSKGAVPPLKEPEKQTL